MSEYHSVEIIFGDIEIFVIDYVKFFQMIADHAHGNIFSIKLTDEEFYFPATLTEFSHRAKQLKHRFQRQIRSLAQKRRHEISRGIDVHQQYPRVSFDPKFKNHLEQLKTHPNIDRIHIIIDALELYDQIQSQTSHLDITFRLLPILQHILKQVEIIEGCLFVDYRSCVVLRVIFRRS